MHYQTKLSFGVARDLPRPALDLVLTTPPKGLDLATVIDWFDLPILFPMPTEKC